MKIYGSGDDEYEIKGGAGMNVRKTKKEILNNLLVAEEMLKEIKEDILVSTKEDKDDDIYCLYNTSLIKRNKIIINKKLKEIERY